MPNPSSRSILGIAFLAILATVCLILGLRSEKEDAGWTVVEEGVFEPLALRESSDNYHHPAEYGIFPGITSPQGGGWLYLRCNAAVPDSPDSLYMMKALPDTYARIETPTGAYAIARLARASDDRSLFCVEIPATYQPGTRSLTVRLVAKNRRDTVVRIDRVPATQSIFPATPSLTSVNSDGAAVKGEAFPTKSKKTGEICGFGYLASWSAPSDKWQWTVTLSSPVQQYVPTAKEKPKGSGHSITIDAQKIHTVGTTQSTPFPTEMRMIQVSGTMNGYEDLEESVDLGTYSILEDGHEKVERRFYLDLNKSITKELPSGLRLTLLPLRSSKDQTMFFYGPTLYYRLQVESVSLDAAVQVKPIQNEKPIVEIRFEGADSYQQIEPPSRNGGRISHFLMHRFEKGIPKKIRFQLDVRRRLLRQRVPFQFTLPIDTTKPKLVDAVYPTVDFAITAISS